jgi:LytR cell envelope-related transcriptional attenuator
MAAARTHGALLEQPRRFAIRLALSVAVVLLAAGGAWRLWPHRREQIQGHAYAVPSPDRSITVEVLNGTRRQGLARVATRVLREQGIDVVFFGNADTTSDSTRVIVRRGDPGRAKDVVEALGAGRLRIDPDPRRRVDATVILGEDYRPKLPLHP